MRYEPTVTPGGELTAVDVDDADDAGNGVLRAVAAGLRRDTGEGLFLLAANRADSVGAGWGYWRDFAAEYLTRLCQTPPARDLIPDVSPLSESDLARLQLSAPPMRGAEYLTSSVLERQWAALDGWVRRAVAEHGEGLDGLLRERAPMWHRVGRVCFHLAENKTNAEYPFAFLATYASGLSRSGRLKHLPLGKALAEYAGARNRPALIKLLAPVNEATKCSLLAAELVDTGDVFHPLAWTPRQAYRLLQEAPQLEQSGVMVRLPDWWRKRPRPQVSVTIGSKKQSRLSLDTMLDFDVRLALGGEELTEEEWRKLQQTEAGLVLLRGQWVEADPARLAEALSHWRALQARGRDGAISFVEGLRLLAGAAPDLAEAADEQSDRPWAFVEAGQWLRETLNELSDPRGHRAARPGRSLKTALRPYQQDGVNWLWLVTGLGLGACLADDMGLGKTVEVLALLLCLKRRRAGRTSLLVLPASLLGNWRNEARRFAPSLKLRFLHAAVVGREALEEMARSPRDLTAGYDLVVTTYAMLHRQRWLSELDWELVILDEAQAIKNPSTRQTRATKRLSARARVAMTGTPIENRLGDLWSLFDFLNPGLLGSASGFKGFIRALEDRRRNRYAPLRRLVGPYILRRLKTDPGVVSDLPDKTEVRAYCGLSRPQAALYAQTVTELESALQGAGAGIERRGMVLAYLMRFKQICNHPSQLLGDGEYAPAGSGKFGRLAEIVEEITSRQEKALVFTQFREVTEPLAEFLSGLFGRSGLVLHGGTPVKQRQRRIDAFQRDDGPPFFVLSLKAGGTGLNLTAASHVIHFDRWWNPAVENQATDRAYRIGQHRNVLVHKFVTRGTVEERIDEMIEEKTQLAGEIIEGGPGKHLTEMGDDELIRFVSLDIQKARI